MTDKYTMHDYLYWRGDLPFSQDPFNEVDNIVLSQMSYVDFDGIVPEGREDKIPIDEVCRQYWLQHTKTEIMQRESFVKMSPFLLEPIAESVRFGKMKLSGYVNNISKDTQSQMSAVQCELEDGTVYVAFRGTDETLIGWREDFNLSFMPQTEGQRLAVEYMNRHFNGTNLKLRIGGHSKGGNFAVYASAFSHPDVKKQIRLVYTNDGPGFRHEITDTEEYRDILARTVSIVPEDSVIGRLLNSSMSPHVIMSSAKGILQHNALTWQIKGNRFVKTEQSPESRYFEKTLYDWLVNVDDAARQIFVDQIFNVLQAGGVDTMKDMRSISFKEFTEALREASRLPREQRKEFTDVLAQLFRSGEKALYEQVGAAPDLDLPGFIKKWISMRENAIAEEEALEEAEAEAENQLTSMIKDVAAGENDGQDSQ